ncbi:MAG: GLUG motif-containing protein, partial [Anaerohalosphaeraceae bacterium]
MWSVVKDLRVVLILAAAMSSVVMAYSGGDGSVGNPYQIDNKADLLELGATPEDYGKCFILTSDIDLAGETFTEAVIAPDMDNYELGFQGFVFTGSFNGDGHIIKNLTIKATDKDYVGLIGYQDRGKVYKLGVENIDITGRGSVGGLVGYNSGTIIACYATDAVTGYTSVGGLVGENAGLITACYATGAVTGDANGGGLVGWHSSGTITACYATGSVSESSEAAGGLVGYRESGIITACFWDIQSSGQAGGSGGKGLTTEQMKTLSIFQNAGWADQGWVINNGEDYPRLSWENTEGVPIPLPQDNPFIGSGTANDPYLIFTPQEFILLNKYSGVLNKYIKLMENLDLNGFTMYPIGDLGSFSGVFDGNGHTISNVIIHLPSNDYVGLFSYVGPCGKIQNLGIENLTITGRDYVGGLVGYADYSDIENCYITGAVNGDEFFIGGIVGYNRFSTILASHAAVSVSGSSISDYVGGLIGCNDSGVIGYSYAVSVVTGDAFVGG